MPCKGLAANGQSLGKGQLLEESGKKLKNLKLGLGVAVACGSGLCSPPHFLHTSLFAVFASSSISAVHKPCKRAAPGLVKGPQL